MFYIMKYDENNEEDVLISFVQNPAIELKGVKLNKEVSKLDIAKKIKVKFNNEKQIVYGPALIANKWIPRGQMNEDGTEELFYIYFDKQTIFDFTQAWKEKGSKMNLEHTNVIIKSNKVLRAEIVDEEKSILDEYPYPQEDVKAGDLFLAVHIEDSDEWQKIKENEAFSFSIESNFDGELIKFSKDAVTSKNKNNDMNKKSKDVKDIKKLLADLNAKLIALESEEEKEKENLEDKTEEEKENLEDKTEEEKEEMENKEDEKENLEDKTEEEKEKLEDDIDEIDDINDVDDKDEDEFKFTEEMYKELMAEIGDIMSRLASLEEGEDTSETTEMKQSLGKKWEGYRKGWF